MEPTSIRLRYRAARKMLLTKKRITALKQPRTLQPTLILCILGLILAGCGLPADTEIAPSSPSVLAVTVKPITPTNIASASATPTGTPVATRHIGTPTPSPTDTPAVVTDTPTVVVEPEVNVELVGQIGGSSNALAVKGQVAYLGVGPRIVVLDISNPRAPRASGQSEVLGTRIVNSVVIAGPYAYVTNADGRFSVLSLADPLKPQVVGALDLPHSLVGLVVHRGYAYAAAGEAGVLIVDIRDPETSQKAGQVATSQPATAVAWADNHLYVTEGDLSAQGVDGFFEVFDVFNPARPEPVGALELPYFAQAVTVLGDYAYLACGRLCVVDVSNPSDPRQIGVFEGLHFYFYDDVAVTGEYAFISINRYCDIERVCPRRAEIVDITDPELPKGHDYQPRANGWTGLGEGRGLVALDGLVYMATETGLKVLDGSTLDLIGAYNSIGLVVDTAVSGKYAYTVDDYQYLHIVDVREPAGPQALSVLENCGICSQVEVSDGYAFVSVWDTGDLAIVDVRNPEEPVTLNQIKMRGGHIATAEDNLYVVVDKMEPGSDLRIIDIKDVTEPVETSSLRLGGSGRYYWRIFTTNGYVYIGSEGRLEVVEVKDAASPQKVGEFVAEPAHPGYRWSTAVDGTYAYLIRHWEGEPRSVDLLVIDLSNPARPQQVASVPLSRGGYDVAILSGYAFVVGTDGLSVVDISNPSAPREVGAFEFSGEKVLAYGGHLYVSGAETGLWILQLSLEGAR